MVTKAFHPWTSDELPQVPKSWGLAAFRGKVSAFVCAECYEPLKLRDEYLYHFGAVTIILHNTVKCWNKYNERIKGNAINKESDKEERSDLPEEKG